MTPSTREDYLRQRLSPRKGDLLYLHLADLRRAIAPLATEAQLTILDYGADLSPYQALFPRADYRAADIGGQAQTRYRIGSDGRVPDRSEVFDLVISTQVAEHVPDPAVYFEECLRLLKPGGTLFLTTHGSFEDHGFPSDYQRWTAQGLARDLNRAGFSEITIDKLTVGPRAALFQVERCLETTWLPRSTLPGLFHCGARHVLHAVRRWLHHLADRWYGAYQVVPSGAAYQNTYIGLAVTARRTASVRPDGEA